MVVQANAETQIRIRSLDTIHGLQSGKIYDLRIFPMDQRLCFDGTEHTASYQLRCLDRTITFSHTFRKEQQYCLLLSQGDQQEFELHIYCLKEDLYQRNPYIGCMHAHSDYSDGQESPAVVAACYRRAGFDFLSITDHGMYAPSLEAVNFYSDVDLGFQIFPGEEVHAPGNKVHLINFGGNESINTYCADHKTEYLTQVENIRKTHDLPRNSAGFEYASCLWAFRKIRSVGGLSILCHPSWVEGNQYNLPAGMYRRFLEEHPFDTLELLNGGNTPWEQADQVSQWMQAGFDGHKVIVTGSDDSHGCINGEWFNICKTYVFSPTAEKEDLIQSIRDGFCVAVEQRPGQAPHFYGENRLVRFSIFLHRFYFPLHHRLCYAEGQRMLDLCMGDETVKESLSRMKGQTDALRQQFWG